MRSKVQQGGHCFINFSMRFSEFQLPPVQNALIIGKRAPVGTNAIFHALEEMTPGMFKLIQIDHPVIEGIIVRKSDLRKMPEKQLISRMLSYAEQIMDETDTLHVKINIEVIAQEEGIEV